MPGPSFYGGKRVGPSVALVAAPSARPPLGRTTQPKEHPGWTAPQQLQTKLGATVMIRPNCEPQQ